MMETTVKKLISYRSYVLSTKNEITDFYPTKLKIDLIFKLRKKKIKLTFHIKIDSWISFTS